MATRQVINVGFPTPNFVAETNVRQSVLSGVFESDTGSSTQTVTASLYNNINTFYSPTVTAGAVDASASFYTNVNTFYSPTVTVSVEASLYSNTNTFYSPDVSYDIFPALYDNTNTFYSPTAVIGDVLSVDNVYVDSDTFYSPTVTGSVVLSPSLYSNTNIFFTPALRLLTSPDLYVNANIFYVPGVAVTANPGFFENTNVFYESIVTPYVLRANAELSIVEQASFSPSIVSLSGVSDLLVSASSGPIAGASIDATSQLTSEDPLWIALEIDIIQEITGTLDTLCLGNRGSLQRTINGVLRQYEPRLLTDIVIGTAISIATDTATTGTTTPFYQSPLRGQPNGGSISWIIDPSPNWYGFNNFNNAVLLGRTFRLYVGRTTTDVMADVDADLTLVYTGHVANYTFDVMANPPVATIQTTDASSNLDKSLVSDLYPADFPIVSLQGRPKPQLWGKKFSIEPVLEDQVSLTYRVTRIEAGVVALEDVTKLTVGGVPWRRITSLFTVDLTPSLANILAQYTALDSTLQAVYNGIVGTDGGVNYNNGNGLQNKANLVGLLTLYQGLTAAQQLDYQLALDTNPSLYNNDLPFGVLNKIGLIKSRYYGLQGGQWMVDIGNGTVQLGSDPAGADVRVDAQAVGWDTLTVASLMTQIATSKGIPVNVASMVQLDLDLSVTVGFYTTTDDVNCLDVLDRIVSSAVCWWTLDETGSVKAGVFDTPTFIVDHMFFGSQPGVPLDINLFPPPSLTPIDPIPKEINSLSQVGVIPPAYRVRVGYAGRTSPESSFLGGSTAQEQADLSASELVLDWTPALATSNSFQLSPSDGAALRIINSRAQDVYISTLMNTYAEAISVRNRLVQRVIGGINHHVWSINVRMDPDKFKLMNSVLVMWIDENNLNHILYSGSFRITSAIMVLGNGPQQLELWGVGYVSAVSRFSAFDAPPVAPPVVDFDIVRFTSYTVLTDAIAGNVIASVSIVVSNGSVFNGFLTVSDPDGIVVTGGNTDIGYTLVLGRDLGPADIGSHTITVTASSQGIVSSQDYTYTVLAEAPTGPDVPYLIVTFIPPTPVLRTPVNNGDVVSTIHAVWSNGAPFVGSFAFTSPYFDQGGNYAISSSNLIVNNANNLNALGVVTAEHVSVAAVPIAPAPVLSVSFAPVSPVLNLPVSNGDVVATIVVTWSDGTPFVGSVSFTSPNFDHNGDYAISGDGSNLIVNNAANLNALGAVTVEHVTIMATSA